MATAAPSVLKPIYVPLSSLLRPQSGVDPATDVVELDPTVFAHPVRRDILHLCVVHHLDSLRQGTASTKTRGEVRGSGAKIRRQKGSGRARLGDGQSPMLRGGGVAFGPKPRDFSTKLPRKVIQMGMRVALSAKLHDGAAEFVESLAWPGTKTKEFAERIEELGWRKTLFITGREKVPDGLRWSSSNIPKLDATTVEDLNVYNLVKFPRLVLDVAAVEALEKKLSKGLPLALSAAEESWMVSTTQELEAAHDVEVDDYARL